MKIEIQSIHFDADSKLLDFIRKKVQKVTTFFEGIPKADIYLRINRDAEKNSKIVEIKLTVVGIPVFVKENSNTFESAIDQAVEKLKVQVKKHKEKLQSKN